MVFCGVLRYKPWVFKPNRQQGRLAMLITQTTASHHLRYWARAALFTTLGIGMPATAQPIQLVGGTLNMFRDTRGANDVGIGQGELFQFGADIVGGSVNVSLGATYPPSGFNTGQFKCSPLAVNGNFCAWAAAFTTSRLDPWTLRFSRGTDSLLRTGPSLAGTEAAVPFPVSVTLSGSGLTPRISWQVPGGFVPDGFRVNLFDKSRILTSGQANVVHSVAIGAASTFYDIPSTFSSGLSLREGGNYSINLQLIDTRGDVPFNNNNAQILRRSSSFFAFTPLSGDNPPDVALPTVVNGVYNFNITQVGPGNITFIDPFVAIGYDYATGPGDPNFASVLLPNVGDGQFTLAFTDVTGAQSVSLAQGSQYFFGAGGVSAFRVSDIETSAGLDPADATAFITGLSFTANGSFTGTMTPITVFVPVPEPGRFVLAALGLLVIGARLRRQRQR